MQLTERQVAGVTVIDVAGDLGANDPSHLKERVKAALGRGERRIILNVAHASGIDSTCLGEIFACHQAAAQVGGLLKLAQPDVHFRRVLHITKVETFIGVHDTEAEAIAGFGVSAS